METDGFRLFPEALSPQEQISLAREVLSLVNIAPFHHPTTPGGRPMSVAMTNIGPLGWVSDRNGYRYQSTHPQTGAPWPAIPDSLIHIWRRFGERDDAPDACLVNRYRSEARMSLHQDRDERDFSAPVVSVSLGDTALFRLGGLERRDPTRSIRLASGDICVLSGRSRLAFHGVDRILSGSSQLIPGGGRLNLTLRLAA
jgi:DNA oxidative demethylase